MAKEETNNGRELQGKVRRMARAEATASVPLVSAKRGKFTQLSDTKIEAVVYARLSDYKAFVREMEGEEPDEGAIVSAALEMLFGADLGFDRWLNDQRRKSRQSSDSNSAKSAKRAAITSAGVGGSI